MEGPAAGGTGEALPEPSKMVSIRLLVYMFLTCGSVMVWGGMSLESRTDLHLLAISTLTTVRSRDMIFRATVRPYACAVGPEFLLVHDNTWPHMTRVCRQFLDDKGIDSIDRPSRSPNLNPIENIVLDIVLEHPRLQKSTRTMSRSSQMPWSSSCRRCPRKFFISSGTCLNDVGSAHRHVGAFHTTDLHYEMLWGNSCKF